MSNVEDNPPEHDPAAEVSFSLFWGARLSLWGCLSGLASVGVVFLAAQFIETSPALADVLLYVALILGFLTTFCMPGLLLTLNGWSHEPRRLRTRGILLGIIGLSWFFFAVRPLLSFKD